MRRAGVRGEAIRFAVRSPAPRSLWPSSLTNSIISWDQRPCDVGVIQTDDLTVDRNATAAALERWAAVYASQVSEEAARLREAGTDLVVGDVPPLAFAAAAAAGIPSVAFANFSWDWIYEHMGLGDAASDAALDYAGADTLVALTPNAPMPAFGRVTRVGLVGRASAFDRETARRQLGARAADCDSLALIAFRSDAGTLIELPPPRDGIIYACVAGSESPSWHGRRDLELLPAGASFIDAVAAADVVVAKPGYGIIGDAGRAGTRLLYAARSGFPEDPVLLSWLRQRLGTREIDARSLANGDWGPDLEELLARPAPKPDGEEALMEACEIVESRLALT